MISNEQIAATEEESKAPKPSVFSKSSPGAAAADDSAQAQVMDELVRLDAERRDMEREAAEQQAKEEAERAEQERIA